MWTCPKCRQKFVNTNQSHSCGQFTVEQFLEGKTSRAIGLFKYFLAQYRKIGRFELHPVKTRIALVTKMRFCAVNKIGPDFIDVHFVLTESCPGKCIRRIDNLEDRFFIHHLRIYRKPDLSAEVRKYMKWAYRVGMREHVQSKNRRTRARSVRSTSGRQC